MYPVKICDAFMDGPFWESSPLMLYMYTKRRTISFLFEDLQVPME